VTPPVDDPADLAPPPTGAASAFGEGRDGDDPDASAVDGRTARRDRNRDAVLDAVIELFTEDLFMPGANEVAERSGVSPRSVYRYFEDAEALTRAAIDRQLELVEPLFHLPAIGEGPLDERIERFVIARLRLWQAVGPTARAAGIRASKSEVMRQQFEHTRELLRDQAAQMFAPELDSLDTADRRAVLGAVDVLCEFVGLDHLCRVRGLTDAQTRDVLGRSLRLLLEPR
jgi:AcrR family transcriptional regulator